MDALIAVFVISNLEKNLSASQLVTGNVAKIVRSLKIFGKKVSSHTSNAAIAACGFSTISLQIRHQIEISFLNSNFVQLRKNPYFTSSFCISSSRSSLHLIGIKRHKRGRYSC